MVRNSDGSYSPIVAPHSGVAAQKKNLEEKKMHQNVTEASFINNFVKVFIGDLETKMRFTFAMYDFDGDGYITPEDVRIMMSYMPFDRNVKI